MKIIVDGMGGDKGIKDIVKGCIDAVNELGANIIIVGQEDIIDKELNKHEYPKDMIEIINSTEVITNDEEPALAIRRKKDSSIVVGLKALADGKGDGFVSAGSTGALLAGGLFIVKRIRGIERACLASVSPKVGLANIGTEEGKGNALVKEAYGLIKNSNLNFVGNAEVRDIPEGICDVIVCDGFVGNVLLKLTEGMAISLFSSLKDEFTKSFKSKIGALMLKSQLKSFKDKLDYREYGGAPLLGLKQPVVKAHGSSDAYAIKNAIRQVKTLIEMDVIKIIENDININE